MQVNLISQINTDSKPIQEKKPRKVFHRSSVARYFLYALALLFPLFFLPFTPSPVAHGKQILAAVLAFGVLLFISSDLVRKGKTIIPPLAFTVAGIAFYISIIISSMLSSVPRESILGTAPDSLFWVSVYLIVFFGVVILAKSNKVYKSLSLFSLLGVGSLLFFVFFREYGFGVFPWEFAKDMGFNATGGLFVPGFLAAAVFVALVVFLSISSVRNNIIKTFAVILSGLSILLIIKYNLWSLWLSLATGFAVAVFILSARSRKSLVPDSVSGSFKIFIIPALVIVSSLFFMVSEKQNPVPFVETFPGAEINLRAEVTWNITRESLSGSRWAHGTGPGTFQYNYTQHKPASINQTDMWSVRFRQGYSALHTYASTWGLAGTGFFVLFLAILLIVNTRGAYAYNAQRDKYSGDLSLRGLAAGAIVFAWVLVVSLVIYRGNVVLHLFMFLSLGLCTGVLMRAGVLKRKTFNVLDRPRAAFLYITAAMLVLVFSFSAVYILGQRYAAQVLMSQGLRAYQLEGGSDEALRLLESAIEKDSGNDDLRRTAARILMFKFQNLAETEDLSQENIGNEFILSVRGAEAYAVSATGLNGLEPQNWITLGEIYESLVMLDSDAKRLAVEAYQNARDIDPKNPSLPFLQARVHISSSDALEDESEKEEELNRAVEKLNESIEIKNDYVSARLMLASAYRRLGALNDAIEQTQILVDRSPHDAGLAFQLGILYYENEEFEEAADALENALDAAGGEFGNARYYLGLAKANLGERDIAIEHFEVLARSNPENETLEGILENLRAGRGVFEDAPENIEDTPPFEEDVVVE